MQTQCPQCRSVYEVDAAYEGKKVQCPQCSAEFIVPAEADLTLKGVLKPCEAQTQRSGVIACSAKTVKIGIFCAIGLLLVAGIVAAIIFCNDAFSGSRSSGGSGSVSAATPGERLVWELPDGVKLEMLRVEAGSFTMSKRDGENYDNEIEHQATLTRDFYLGKTEVTQEQWKAVMGTSINELRDKAGKSEPLCGAGNDYPIYYVSWNDAMRFCDELNRRGLAPTGWKFMLPTETQWEYAAVGGKKSCGYKYSGSNTLNEVGWFSDNSQEATHPVGRKAPNELGFFDMSGNVWEWCLDDCSENSSKAQPEFSRGNDQWDSDRVIRGGGWGRNARRCRSACRDCISPGCIHIGLGFRVALVPERY